MLFGVNGFARWIIASMRAKNSSHVLGKPGENSWGLPSKMLLVFEILKSFLRHKYKLQTGHPLHISF